MNIYQKRAMRRLFGNNIIANKKDGFDDFDPQDIIDKARTRLLNSKKRTKRN